MDKVCWKKRSKQSQIFYFLFKISKIILLFYCIFSVMCCFFRYFLPLSSLNIGFAYVQSFQCKIFSKCIVYYPQNFVMHHSLSPLTITQFASLMISTWTRAIVATRCIMACLSTTTIVCGAFIDIWYNNKVRRTIYQ